MLKCVVEKALEVQVTLHTCWILAVWESSREFPGAVVFPVLPLEAAHLLGAQLVQGRDVGADSQENPLAAHWHLSLNPQQPRGPSRAQARVICTLWERARLWLP